MAMASLELRGRVEASDRGVARENEKETTMPPPALNPPSHLIARIFIQLDCIDLLHCSLVCKQWYRDSAELREDWKNEYLESCNQYWAAD